MQIADALFAQPVVILPRAKLNLELKSSVLILRASIYAVARVYL